MKITVKTQDITTEIESSPDDAFALSIYQDGCINIDFGDAAFLPGDDFGDDDDGEDTPEPNFPPYNGRIYNG